MCEADEINTEDLESAAEYFGQLASGALPQQEACRMHKSNLAYRFKVYGTP